MQDAICYIEVHAAKEPNHNLEQKKNAYLALC